MLKRFKEFLKLSFIPCCFLMAVTASYGQCTPDTTNPLIIAPPSITTNNDIGVCHAYISPSTLSYPTVFDQCGIISTVASNVPSGYNFPVGSTVITWTVTDYSGNFSTATQTITVVDNEPPQIQCPNTVTVTASSGTCSAFVNVPIPVASDNCSITSSSNSFTGSGLNASGTYPLGSTQVTYTVTDAANLSSTCTLTIEVVSADLPVISLNGSNSITLEACNTYNELGATATDVCEGDISSNIVIDASNLNINAVGTYQVIYHVSNAAGLAATPVIRTVSVVDTTPPTLSLIGPSVLTIGDCSTYTELGATATDPCFGNISSNVVIDNSSVDTSTLGSYTVTYWVTDNQGNSASSITRTVVVTDSNPPEITLIGDNPLILEACTPYNDPGATAIDPCFGNDYSASLIIDSSGLDTSIPGIYSVSYNAVDSDGNAAIEVIRTVEVIDTTPPVLTLLGDSPQIVSACTPYIEYGATAIDPCFGTDFSSSIVIDSSSLDTNTEGTYYITYSVCDAAGNCTSVVSREVQVVISNPVANAGSDYTNNICTDTTITLSGNAVLGNGSSGSWSVTSGQNTGFSFSDTSSPTSSFTGEIGETYVLTWTIDNPLPCPDVSDSITVSFINCSALDFDGADDNITFKNNYNFTTDFTIEFWMKSELQNASPQTLISKRDAFSLTNGYDLSLVNNYVSFNWNNGETLQSAYPVNTNQWHHIALSFNGSTYTLFIDGLLMGSVNGSLPISNSQDCIVGAMDQQSNPPFKPVNYFDGGMDELRIWQVALSEDQIRHMMNQEITSQSGAVYGSTIPLEITGLNWTHLLGYYQMNQDTDIVGGNLVSVNSTGANGLLRYMTTYQPETAPIPYHSTNDGFWDTPTTWLHGTVQAIPNSLGIDGSTPIDWNIVKTQHLVESGNRNITVLGLEVTNNRLRIANSDTDDGQSLRVMQYLKLDGTLDLVGESQLLQDLNSLVDYSGSGVLERDQQGTVNLFNYNYWSSPVSNNGLSYSVGNILYDGTVPTAPIPVLWTSSNNATGSSNPITLSYKWLYTFENFPANSYADWVYKSNTGNISVGLGYTMKGSGVGNPLTDLQNYVFIGKPNNGDITVPISAHHEALVGNPYASALDAHAFILDNISSTLGTLYFWEHYTSNTTHVLEDYEGGYAAYNLTGGTPAISPPEVSGNGNPLKIPERYVPVGQGFFVEGNATGGQIQFNNHQRAFVKEQVSGSLDNGSVFFKNLNTSITSPLTDAIKRVRIKATLPYAVNRHLLLGFTNNQATDAYDYGYDGINTETLNYDVSWNIENQNYIIQGVGVFNETKLYPLEVFLSTDGVIEFSLVGLENFETAVDVYIYDAFLDISYPINSQSHFQELTAGTYSNRFYIAFQPVSKLSTEDLATTGLDLYFNTQTSELVIENPLGWDVETITIYNLLGQSLIHSNKPDSYKTLNQQLKIPIKHLAEGPYFVTVTLKTQGVYSKKVIISY